MMNGIYGIDSVKCQTFAPLGLSVYRNLLSHSASHYAFECAPLELEKFPELGVQIFSDHKITRLKHQIRNLQDYLTPKRDISVGIVKSHYASHYALDDAPLELI